MKLFIITKLQKHRGIGKKSQICDFLTFFELPSIVSHKNYEKCAVPIELTMVLYWHGCLICAVPLRTQKILVLVSLNVTKLVY